jgi:hypothetical protein
MTSIDAAEAGMYVNNNPTGPWRNWERARMAF